MSANKHIRSFVKRSGRLTNSQKLFFNNKENDSNYINEKKIINYNELFNNENKCILDIGFGDGKLLINIAKKFPGINFIGVEVYESGIGSILKDISNLNLRNLKIVNIDAIELLKNNIKNKSLHGVSLFFPDPWPKKKHFKRRIINNYFIDLISRKIQIDGFIKIVTDWADYAYEIINLFDNHKNFKRVNEILYYQERDLTKFEKKGIILGHKITDLSFKAV